MKGFAEIALPLSEQLKGKERKKTAAIQWTVEMIEAFQKLKDCLLQNVVLDIADPYKPYVLEVDASD